MRQSRSLQVWPRWNLLLVLTALAAVLSTCCAAQQPTIACQLTIQGGLEPSGISRANLACTGGAITAAAEPLLLPHVRNAVGVKWSSNGCGLDPGGCLLAICGSSQAHFVNAVIVGVHGLDLESLLCIVGNSSLLLSNATLQGNTGTVVRVANASIELINSTVADNMCVREAHTAGIHAAGTAMVSIQGSRFVNNSHISNGGAITAMQNATVNISTTAFHRNRVTCGNCGGGAVCAHDNARGMLTFIAAPRRKLMVGLALSAQRVAAAENCCREM